MGFAMRKWSDCPTCGHNKSLLFYTHNPGVCIDGTVETCEACSQLFKIPFQDNLNATQANVDEYTGNFIEDDTVAS